MIQEAGRSGSNTHTLNEVLNGDFVSLAQLLEENAPIDILGIRGEGPIHIAVYRIDMRMLRMLLDHTPRANINFKNIEGNTALHIAALMGLVEILKLLYSYSTVEERFQLFLEIKNNQGETCFDIASKPVENHELDLTRLYAVSDNVGSLSSVRETMVLGRRACCEFIKAKMLEDRNAKVENSVRVLVDCNIARFKTNSILRGGVAGTDYERAYSGALDYPKALDPLAWQKADVQYFLNYEPGVREVVLGTHARDLQFRIEKTAAKQVDLQERIIDNYKRGTDLDQERWNAPPESFGKEWSF